MAIELSRVERWILSNQYRILEALYPEEADHLAHAREALEQGFEGRYEDLASHIDESVLSPQECREVVDILAMYDALQRSRTALGEQTKIKEEEVRFAGFDGNNETAQMVYARHFCGGPLGRFQGLDTAKDFNSHFPSLDSYRAMLRVWKDQCKGSYQMTEAQIRQVLDAQ